FGGRGFDARDVAAGARSAVVGEALWRRLRDARHDSSAVIQIHGERYDVVGVVADGHEYPEGTELWLPYRHKQRGGATRNNINWQALGRLTAGATAAQASSDIAAVARRIRASEPMALYSFGALVTPLRDEVIGPAARYLRLLLGAVTLVLLIGCANLASANLARGASRSQEMAVRAALGAGRGRIVRQLLVEHLLLAAIGGAAGVALAWALVRGIVFFSAHQLPRVREVHIDGRVLAFGCIVSAVAGIAAGLLPAIDAGRASLRGAIGSAGRGTVRGGSAGRALVATEIALAVMLVSGAGLLVQSFRTLLARPLGFETRGVVTADIALDGARYGRDPAKFLRYWNELLPALRSTPGVAAAGAANWIPLGTAGSTFIEIAGRDVSSAGAGYRVVSDGYFGALRVPLMRGRLFDAGDDSSATRVAIVNHRMAAMYWPGDDPIGTMVRAPSMELRRAGAPAAWMTIVGVVGDVRHFGLESEPRPELYVALAQQPMRAFSLTAVVRGADGLTGDGSVGSLARVVRERIRATDPDVAADVEPLGARLDRSTAERRFTMSALSVFGALALALAGLGVYGVLSFSVAQRTRELAVRAALGAERGALLRLVLGAGLRVICAGAAAGLLAALALTRLMRSLLFEVSPRDPAVLATATMTIVAVGVVAALVPAYRATRVEPMRVLD
ncbi:MAG: FtsX-like permease family protein, partial [Gemmatimonadaceae bacterium]